MIRAGACYTAGPARLPSDRPAWLASPMPGCRSSAATYGGTKMQTQTPKQQDLAGVVGAIRREYEVLDRWLSAVSPAHWQGATYCDEWTVQKTVSHLGSGAEIHQLTILEHVDGTEPTTQEVRERIWGHFDSLASEPLHADFRDRNERYLTYLEQLPTEKRDRLVKFFAGEPAEAEGEVSIAGDRAAALRLNALFPGF